MDTPKNITKPIYVAKSNMATKKPNVNENHVCEQVDTYFTNYKNRKGSLGIYYKIIRYMEIVKQSPNISKNPIKPLGIILHHSAGTYKSSVDWCLRKESKVTYHCMVDLNGDRTILAKDTQRAWHAGVSRFKGRNDCNTFMLGISVTGDTNKRRLSEFEIESVARWCVEKMKIWKFGLDWITTHREVSPGRKDDVSVEAEKQIKERIVKLLNI